MKSKFDVVALGELLIDFTPCGSSEGGMALYERNPGGAPANVLCTLANLGLKTAFLGKVGEDMHGDFLRAVLQEKGIDTSGLVQDGDVFTTLAFVKLTSTGERSFSFARKPGADTCLRADELDRQALESCSIFHFGSLSLTDEPSRSATIEAAQIARGSGAVISYDPNYRAPLWSSEDEAAVQIRSVFPLVDIVKISSEETMLVTGHAAQERASDYLLDQGIGCVVITLGEDGAFAANRNGSIRVPSPPTAVRDTTGAGDAFWGGFLYKLVSSVRKPHEISLGQLEDFTGFANCVAALCVQKRGAIPSLPTIEEVTAFSKR